MSDAGSDDFVVRFFGVRDGTPHLAREPSVYGGNTCCVELGLAGRLVIFDAGTGIRPLGERLAGDAPLEADIFFSMIRYDHLCGLPFFAPVYDPRNRIRLWADPDLGGGLEAALDEMMSPPLFPIPPAFMGGVEELVPVRPGHELAPRPGVTVRGLRLRNPAGATGFRLGHAGRALAYLCGTGPVGEEPDPAASDLIEGADLLIYDGLDAGEAGWREGVRLCRAGGAGRLVVFNHRFDQSDAELDRRAAALDAALPGAILAREGLTLNL